ncbi:MAG: ATP-binding protein [Alphaproteobacteria bacterium]|nr:ATP-binding protein [Alphaproteobacteria bacterium]
MKIERDHFLSRIRESFDLYKICALLGPRQCGKTTLAREFIKSLNEPCYFFDLEDPVHLDQLKNPKLTLDPLDGLIVIDEVQRRPDLFPYLRVLSDYSNKKFLLLGSSSGDLLRQSSEALTGRIEYIELTTFSLKEVDSFDRHWLQGGFPKAYLSSFEISRKWQKNYIVSFIERDLPALDLRLNSTTMYRLWQFLSHYHGQLVNYSDIGRGIGVSDMNIRRYLDILEKTFMIRLLLPWHENISKRQVKAPKVYIRDSGLFHSAIGITENEWFVHPQKGSSFEGYAIEEIVRFLGDDARYYFWRTQAGAELDLYVLKNGKKIGFEIKLSDAPTITKSMKLAMTDLKLDHLYIVNSSNEYYQKTEDITVMGIKQITKLKKRK